MAYESQLELDNMDVHFKDGVLHVIPTEQGEVFNLNKDDAKCIVDFLEDILWNYEGEWID